MSHHTIVLLQANPKPASRQYSDFENEEKAMDGQTNANHDQRVARFDGQRGTTSHRR
jgi:hypothetical protein